MPATTVIPAAQVQPAARTTHAPALSLEARMAVVDAAMTIRLEEASLANDINTAHIQTPAVDLADVIRGPIDTPRTPVDLHPTPVANLLQRTHRRLTDGGWCGHTPTSVPGPDCLQSAIYKEAGGNHGLASDALDVLMDAIRQQFGGDVGSVPSFNDAWGGPHVPLRLLRQAADLADARAV